MNVAALKELLETPAIPLQVIESRLADLTEQELQVLTVALLGEHSALNVAGRARLDSALRTYRSTTIQPSQPTQLRDVAEPTRLREPTQSRNVAEPPRLREPTQSRDVADPIGLREPTRSRDVAEPTRLRVPPVSAAATQHRVTAGGLASAAAGPQPSPARPPAVPRDPGAFTNKAAPPNTPAPPATTARVLSHAGLVLNGHYRLESPIGQGAMGQVWRARDLLSEEAGAPETWVAIKLFVAEFASAPDALAIMQREASRAEGLAHPNIVTVRFFDRDDESGLLFMGMDLVDGESLDEILRKRAPEGLGCKEGGMLIRGIADGLSYAHAKGIVHCDLKPGNILVTRSGVPKLLDFGISQAVARGEGHSTHTAERSLVSGYTEEYASPDVLSDRPLPPNEGDDLYALGAVAYELLSGRRPYGERSSLEAKRQRLKPQRISGLRRHEWRALARALTLERSARWQSVEAFRKAYVGRPPAQQALLAAAAVSVLVAGGFAYRSYVASGPAVPLAALPADTQSEVRLSLSKAREALDYVQRTNDYSVLDDAVDAFDRAYALHPRNREAVAGLKQTADLAIRWATTQHDPREAARELETLRGHTVGSGFYNQYPPLNRMIERLDQRSRERAP